MMFSPHCWLFSHFAGCDAVFPGYGFLSENADFVGRCEEAGIAFIGPTADTMRQFSQKHTARALAEAAGVPILPGTDLLTSGEEALEAARTIGLPVLLKATGGSCVGCVGVMSHASQALLLTSLLCTWWCTGGFSVHADHPGIS